MLLPRQCRRLHEEHILEYDGQEIKVSNLNSISAQLGLFGTAYLADGTCWVAKPFTLKGVRYESNWILASFTGRVTKRKVNYDPTINRIKLENKDVSVSKGEFEGRRSTFLWDVPHSTCISSVQEIYRGQATIIDPGNQNLKKQAIVTDISSGITFALELSKSRSVWATSWK